VVHIKSFKDMQQKNKNNSIKREIISATNSKEKKPVGFTPKQDLLGNFDSFLQKYLKIIFWIGLSFTILFSFLLFDFRVSDGGDDSTYIVRAYDLLKNGLYPTFQGPLYPMVLSLFMAIFGVKVTLFKTLSLIFIVVQFILFYKAFAKRIPATLLVAVLLITSVCASLLYFSSQTYSEAFFMMLQSLFVFLVFKFIIDRWDEEFTINGDWGKFLLLGLVAMASYLARNVGLVSILVLIAFLLMSKKWKGALFSLCGFIAVFIPIEFLKRLIFNGQAVQFSAQGKTLLLKDFYSPVKGNEDAMGMIHRFFDNAHIYLSKHFFVFTGLKSAELPTATHAFTYIIFAIAIVALILTFKRNKFLFFAVLYTGGIAAITFFAVQASWDQPRLVIVFYPLLLLSLLSGLYYLLTTNFGKKIQILLPIIIVILFFASFKSMLTATSLRSKGLQANLSGNLYYGMTPDWVNYIEMSKYAAKTVPATEMIACRKPDISFVYTGTKFYGIYTIPSIELDSFLLSLKVQATQKVIGLNLMKINENPKTQLAHNKLVKYTHAFINANLLDENKTAKESKVIGVYIVPTEVADTLIPVIQTIGAEFVDDIPAVLQKIQKENWSYAIQNPESMLQTLKDNHVHYAILASLRKVPQYNTGEVISTLHRFIYFIQLKYPNIVQQIHTIGDTEPASLLKFNY
jgi:hypothetical protein